MTSYGKSCEKCRVYFVATDRDQRLCPWCLSVERGAMESELYEPQDGF